MTHIRSAATIVLVLWVLLESGLAVRGDCNPGETNYTTIVTVQDYYVMKGKNVQYKISKEICCPGYSDASSSRCVQSGCLNGNFGDNCIHPCSCPENAHKNCAQTGGKCLCFPGWQGTLCTIACEPGYYGVDCKSTCECEKRATCNNKTGQCICPPGWEGDFCEKACTNKTYGYNCTETCQCNLDQICDHVTGNCGPCKPGHSNPPQCDKACPLWSFGQNCSQNCSCDQERTRACNSLNGTCDCKPGYRGTDCKYECPPGSFGDGCNSSCENCTYGSCNNANGSCYSCYGRRGPNCTEECPAYTFGFDCLSQCQCVRNHSNGTCDSCSGACNCRPGWTGYTCDIECPVYMSDTPCQSIVFGNRCEPYNITMSCSDGWTGEYCTELCEHGRYGRNCSSYCKCDDGQVCNPATGECTCKSGYTGENCTTECPLGTYGFKCSLNCTCNKKEQCHPVNGSCDCMFGLDRDYCAKALQSSGNDVYILVILVLVFVLAAVIIYFIYKNIRKRLEKNIALGANHGEKEKKALEQHTIHGYAKGNTQMVEQMHDATSQDTHTSAFDDAIALNTIPVASIVIMVDVLNEVALRDTTEHLCDGLEHNDDENHMYDEPKELLYEVAMRDTTEHNYEGLEHNGDETQKHNKTPIRTYTLVDDDARAGQAAGNTILEVEPNELLYEVAPRDTTEHLYDGLEHNDDKNHRYDEPMELLYEVATRDTTEHHYEGLEHNGDETQKHIKTPIRTSTLVDDDARAGQATGNTILEVELKEFLYEVAPRDTTEHLYDGLEHNGDETQNIIKHQYELPHW